jgi:hypothetical protein
MYCILYITILMLLQEAISKECKYYEFLFRNEHLLAVSNLFQSLITLGLHLNHVLYNSLWNKREMRIVRVGLLI